MPPPLPFPNLFKIFCLSMYMIYILSSFVIFHNLHIYIYIYLYFFPAEGRSGFGGRGEVENASWRDVHRREGTSLQAICDGGVTGGGG